MGQIDPRLPTTLFGPDARSGLVHLTRFPLGVDQGFPQTVGGWLVKTVKETELPPEQRSSVALGNMVGQIRAPNKLWLGPTSKKIGEGLFFKFFISWISDGCIGWLLLNLWNNAPSPVRALQPIVNSPSDEAVLKAIVRRGHTNCATEALLPRAEAERFLGAKWSGPVEKIYAGRDRVREENDLLQQRLIGNEEAATNNLRLADDSFARLMADRFINPPGKRQEKPEAGLVLDERERLRIARIVNVLIKNRARNQLNKDRRESQSRGLPLPDFSEAEIALRATLIEQQIRRKRRLAGLSEWRIE